MPTAYTRGVKDTLICPTGETFPVAPRDPAVGYTLDELYDHLNADVIEVVPIVGGNILIIDEEGGLKALPWNKMASQFAGCCIRGFALLAAEGNLR